MNISNYVVWQIVNDNNSVIRFVFTPEYSGKNIVEKSLKEGEHIDRGDFLKTWFYNPPEGVLLLGIQNIFFEVDKK